MLWLTLKIIFWITGAFWLLALLNCFAPSSPSVVCPKLDSLPSPSHRFRHHRSSATKQTPSKRPFAKSSPSKPLIFSSSSSTTAPATPPRKFLNQLASEFSQLKIVTIDHLPENWLGKLSRHARGRHYSNGEWLLFTDGDIWLSPDVAARAIAAAQSMGVDHVTLAPRQHMAENQKPGALYQSVMLMFQMVMNVHLGRANRDCPNSMAGIGAFNLIRADLYNKIGGHEALRLEVADDMKLGLLVRRANPPANLVRCSPKMPSNAIGPAPSAASSAPWKKTCGPA